MGVVGTAAVVIACTGCGGGGTRPGSELTTSQMAPSVGVELTAGQNPSLGTILTDANGMTLYHYSPEKGGQVECVGSCVAQWPPFTVTIGEKPVAGPGVVGRLSTTVRPDGGIQVTYDGLPLYRYRKDTVPGEASGEGLGGMWTVIALTPTGSTGSTQLPVNTTGSTQLPVNPRTGG